MRKVLFSGVPSPVLEVHGYRKGFRAAFCDAERMPL